MPNTEPHFPNNVLDLNRDPEGQMIMESPYELVVEIRRLRNATDHLRERLQHRMDSCSACGLLTENCGNCKTDELVMKETLG